MLAALAADGGDEVVEARVLEAGADAGAATDGMAFDRTSLSANVSTFISEAAMSETERATGS